MGKAGRRVGGEAKNVRVLFLFFFFTQKGDKRKKKNCLGFFITRPNPVCALKDRRKNDIERMLVCALLLGFSFPLIYRGDLADRTTEGRRICSERKPRARLKGSPEREQEILEYLLCCRTKES